MTKKSKVLGDPLLNSQVKVVLPRGGIVSPVAMRPDRSTPGPSSVTRWPEVNLGGMTDLKAPESITKSSRTLAPRPGPADRLKIPRHESGPEVVPPVTGSGPGDGRGSPSRDLDRQFCNSPYTTQTEPR